LFTDEGNHKSLCGMTILPLWKFCTKSCSKTWRNSCHFVRKLSRIPIALSSQIS